MWPVRPFPVLFSFECPTRCLNSDFHHQTFFFQLSHHLSSCHFFFLFYLFGLSPSGRPATSRHLSCSLPRLAACSPARRARCLAHFSQFSLRSTLRFVRLCYPLDARPSRPITPEPSSQLTVIGSFPGSFLHPSADAQRIARLVQINSTSVDC